jgi:acetylornithine deacetylase/succinyl-diaminopimelate desuccinylase-like protein
VSEQTLTPADLRAAKDELEEIVRTLAGWKRPSASDGELRAAEWIAARLDDAGLNEVRLEREPAHGGYWWPLGLLSLASGSAALLGGRLTRLFVGSLAALGIWDELALSRGVWTRRFARRRRTTNVVGELGRRDAGACMVLIAHHDAAHSGAIFDPTVTYAFGRRFPRVIARLRAWPRIMYLVLVGPILVALGSRRLGAALSLGSAAAFADIARSDVVDGANDNLSGVAALISLARSMSQAPPDDVRMIFLSAGAEESFEEGSQAFLRRHRDTFPDGSTYVIAIDAVGSPYLLLLEGEGMLERLEYDVSLKYTLEQAAHEAGIEMIREHWLSFGSDALAGLRAGYPSVLVASFDDMKLPANYHWRTDVPDNVDYETIAQATIVIEAAIRRLAAHGPGR